MRSFNVLLSLLIASWICGCALHPCGETHVKAKRADYTFVRFRAGTNEYKVAVTRGRGAPILVMHGLAGLSGATLEWAAYLRDRGWKVYLPMLESQFDECDPITHWQKIKGSPNWNINDPQSSGQVLYDMESLADWVSKRSGNRRIVAVGNCLTGGFPFAMLGRDCVKTAVLCQPALPIKTWIEAILRLPQSPKKRLAFGVPDSEVAAALNALQSDPTKRLYGFHYLNDKLAPMEKFAWLHQELLKREIPEKFRPVILVPKGSHQETPWWDTMETTARSGLVKPHVTLTGADEPDRARLRQKFDELIRP